MTIDDVAVAKHDQAITLEISQIERGGFDHFMLKEIHEQPTTIRNAMRGRLLVEEGERRARRPAEDDGQAAECAQDHHQRLRHVVACGAGRRVHVRADRAGPDGSGICVGVPVPEPDREHGRRGDPDQPERRDGGHPCGAAGGEEQGRDGARHRERGGEQHRARTTAACTCTRGRRSGWRRQRRSPRS